MPIAAEDEFLLEVRDLAVDFQLDDGKVRAVDGVSFAIRRGEILGLVGESGSGKSVTSLAIMGLLPPRVARVQAGSILFDGQDLFRLAESQMRKLRGGRIGMIFQEPLTALNPVFTVGYQIVTGILAHERIPPREARERAIELLRMVHIADPTKSIEAYPFQMSGGMRQRVLIAMALASRPDLLIADEPTTALDVTIQAQILDLLREIRERTGIAILFITHDLAVIAELCDSVAVMYAGEVQERGSVASVFGAPRHPYTRGLLACIADPTSGKALVAIEGRPPTLSELAVGCRFSPRCPHAQLPCAKQHPQIEVPDTGREVRCLRWREIPTAS
jgi:oligopeptide/dipeptide ABC transporter ATP-binding protein